ncbi:6361_t:CDS:1, partial [Entrophospora sp. SA101]
SGSLRHILNNSSDLDCQTNELQIIEILEEIEACKKKFNSSWLVQFKWFYGYKPNTRKISRMFSIKAMKTLNPIDKDSIEFINYGNNELDTLLNFYGKQKKVNQEVFFPPVNYDESSIILKL